MNIILLGGNGYIGRAVTEYWLQQDKQAQFWVLSRSGNNALQHARVQNVAVDVMNWAAVQAVLPEHIDYVLDFIGAPEAHGGVDMATFNRQPAEIMRQIAEQYQAKAMGFVGGLLGPKAFTDIKRDIIAQLRQSSIPLAVVEPTLVYGNGRSDKLAKFVPLLHFFGIFSAKFKPVLVENVARELVDKLRAIS